MARIDRIAPAAALIAAALLAGCAEGQPRAAPAAPAGPARLIVRETLPTQPIYREGTIAFLRVERLRSRTAVIDGPVTRRGVIRGRGPLLDRKLAPGAYRLVSYQRPCDGNCGYLDPPTARCEATVELAAGDTRTVTVVLDVHGGCSVRSRASA
jgi:hypothetical protein